MVHVVVMRDEQSGVVEGGIDLLDTEGRKWVDVLQPTEEVMSVLAKKFGLHRLEVEDCLHLDQRPKLEEFPDHLFVVIQSYVSHQEDPCALDMREMHLFFGRDWVITVHDRPSDAVTTAKTRVLADPAGTLGRGTDFVGYLVADAAVDGNFPVLDQLSDELESLESQIFERQTADQLQRIFELKRSLMIVRRVMSPQRDVIGLLSRPGLPFIGERTVFYFRDVYDHLVRLYESIDAARDLVGNATEAYLSMLSNKTNDTTKKLTIFASLFLPLSFITGFFGQNFEVLSQRPFFYLMLTSVLGLPVALTIWFRRLHWF
jgi:magnesium transporter